MQSTIPNVLHQTISPLLRRACTFSQQSTLLFSRQKTINPFHRPITFSALVLQPSTSRLHSISYSVASFSSTTPTHFAVKRIKMPALTEEQRNEVLTPLLNNGWKTVTDRDAIQKTFTFKDFNEAFGFMSRVALLAEKLNHHPEWFNVYNRVEVTLTTHDCSGISQNDIKVANFMDKIA